MKSKQNHPSQRLLTALLCVCMMLTMIPTAALAVESGFDDSTMTELNLSEGAIKITDTGVTAGVDAATVTPNLYGYHITGNNTVGGARKVHNILITADTTIELDNIALNMSAITEGDDAGAQAYNTYAILISGGANVTIYLKGTNKITAAGRFAGITVADDSSVTIKCPTHSDLPDGDRLKGRCRDANAACDPSDGGNPTCTNILDVSGSYQIDGELHDMGSGAIGSSDISLSAPGIGGVSGYNSTVGLTDMGALGFDEKGTAGGTINIEGGVITAQSLHGSSACIGSGSGAEKAGKINISGGMIRAYGKGTAAGIGGGVGSAGGDVTITGNAYVDADGGSGGAGIGGGGCSNWNPPSGVPTIDTPGAGGTVTISGNAIVEACGGGVATSATGTAAGIGPGANSLDILNGNYTAGAIVSIDKSARVYAWSRGELPAITTVDGLNHSADPANVLNHRIRESVENNDYLYLQLFPQADNVGSSDFTGSVETPYASQQEKLPNKGSKNFAYTVEEAGYYSEKVSIGDASSYTPMGHAEEKTNTYYTTTGLAHQDVVFYVSTLEVEDVTVNYGESGTLTVTPRLTEPDTNPIVSYSWEIKESNAGFTAIPDTDVTTYSYEPTSVESNTSFPTFRCVATLQDGTKISSNEAKVYARGLDLTIRPDDVDLDLGDALPAVNTLTVQYDGFINADAADTLQFLYGVAEVWGMIFPQYAPLSLAVPEFQKQDGTVITTTDDLDAGVYNIVYKLPTAQAEEDTCRDYANYYLKPENGKLFYGVPKYDVTFDAKGGNMTDPTSVEIHENELVVEPAAPTKAGFAFGGWYTDDGTFAHGWDFDVDRVQGPTTLYAKWLSDAATVTFKVVNGAWNDGSTADKTAVVTLVNGKGTLTAGDIPTGMVAGSGYEDGAWNTTPSTAADAITGDVTYTYSFAKADAATVTFKVANGQWADGTTVDKTVSVVLSGGKGTLSTSDIPTGMTANSGYEGGAWNTTPNTTADAVTGNITYTYSFTKKSTGGGGTGGGTTTYYTLNFITNGGSKVSAEKHSANSTVKLSQTTAWKGHEFLGWYSDVKLTEPVTSIKMTGDKTVYAKWNPAHDAIPGVLNGDDHNAYIVGREDGLVHPEDNITRAEVTAIVFRLLKDDVRQDNLTTANGFTDVNPEDWYSTAVSTVAKLGVVKGRGEGIFDPNASITRAEFAAIMSRFDSTSYTGEDKFPDIADSWARDEINRAAARGWVQGDETGNFRPNDFITRAEVVTLINRVLVRAPQNVDALLSGMKTWPDNQDTSMWYYLAIQEATNSHDYDRLSGSSYEKWIKLTKNPDWNKLEQ